MCVCVHVVPLGDVSMGYIEFQHVICQFPLFLNPIGKSVAPHKTQNMGCRYLDTHCSSVLVYAMFKTVATDVILCGIFFGRHHFRIYRFLSFGFWFI